jgi:chaperonin GroES
LHLTSSDAGTQRKAQQRNQANQSSPIAFEQHQGADLKKNMTISIEPLHDRVIVKRIDEGEQVRGGIIIPDSAKEKPQEGEVIAAGKGKYREDGSRQALDVKAGDRVLFGKYGGSEVNLEGEEVMIMREDEILGIIKRAGAAASSGSGKKGSK